MGHVIFNKKKNSNASDIKLLFGKIISGLPSLESLIYICIYAQKPKFWRHFSFSLRWTLFHLRGWILVSNNITSGCRLVTKPSLLEPKLSNAEWQKRKQLEREDTRTYEVAKSFKQKGTPEGRCQAERRDQQWQAATWRQAGELLPGLKTTSQCSCYRTVKARAGNPTQSA